jgi:hypothetical protein
MSVSKNFEEYERVLTRNDVISGLRKSILEPKTDDKSKMYLKLKGESQYNNIMCGKL